LRLAVFASGSGTNFEVILNHFKDSDLLEIACLVCDQPEARALEIARENGIETFEVECKTFRTRLDNDSEERITEFLKDHKIDLIALAGYMRVMKSPLLRAFPGRIVNIHPSLLPSFRGLHAVKQALDYGVKVTGCTIHLVDEKIDHGIILGQSTVIVESGDDEDSLHQKIHQEEYKLYPAILEAVARKTLDLDAVLARAHGERK
jgi:phosphoribosylglycinamide formyltransferase-1